MGARRRNWNNAGLVLVCTAALASSGILNGVLAKPPASSQLPTGDARDAAASASQRRYGRIGRNGRRRRYHGNLDEIERKMRQIVERHMRRAEDGYAGNLEEEQSLHRSIDPVAVDNKQQGPCEQCLYPSFAAIRKSLEKYDHCKTVVYTVALYPPRNQVTGNRTYGHVDESLSSPRHWDVKFPSPASGKEEGLCNLALVTTNTIVPTRHYEGWTMVDIPDDLIPVPGQHSRSAHTLRATPFLLFPAAERIYYADTKCNISTFYEKTRDRNPDAKMVALKHKDFYQKPGNMLREFDEAFMHLKQRHVPLQDLKDILFQLQKYRAEGFLTTEREISLSDNMCLYFQKDTKAMQDFLCTWNCEIMNESMRTQLSFAYAVEKAGLEPGKDVEYVEYYYGDRERSSRKTWSLRLRSRGSGSHGRQ